MPYSQREIDAYYSQRQPCPSCGANWRAEGDAFTIHHHHICDFIDEVDDDRSFFDEINQDMINEEDMEHIDP